MSDDNPEGHTRPPVPDRAPISRYEAEHYAIYDGGLLLSLNHRLFTVYLAMPDTPRGHYDEEIDIIFTGRGKPSMAAVRRCAQREIDANYNEGLSIKRVSLRW